MRAAIISAMAMVAGTAAAQPILLPNAPTGVETFVDQGIQFSRINAANVQALNTTGPIGRPIGGGTWDFGLSRTELTQAQWLEFTNSFVNVPVPQDQPWSSRVTSLLRGDGWVSPGIYGTVVGPQGRFEYAIDPALPNMPVRGSSWFGAAAYVNWLQNDRQASMTAITTGVYDLAQWNWDDNSTWTAPTRSAGARYWIPTFDEWSVASFYDANRYGPSQPGWWPYLNGRERLPVSGPPGVGETAFGWNDPINAILLPIAAYPGSQSPWGLLDTSGTFTELLDDQWPFGLDRLTAGTRAGPLSDPNFDVFNEQPGWYETESPGAFGMSSFRIASSTVPSAPTLVVLALGLVRVPRTRV